MRSNDPYGIAAYKDKKNTAAQHEKQLENILSELLSEMKCITDSLSKIEKKL